MEKTKLALVDDEALILSLLADYFQTQEDIELIGTWESGTVFLQELEDGHTAPDVLILDLRLKDINGIEVLEALKTVSPTTKTIVMSSHYNQRFMGFMLKTGAAGFIPKGIRSEELVDIVREVQQKGFFFMPNQMEIIRDQVSSRAPEPNLKEGADFSEREIEVLELICQQYTAKEIGEKLFITQRTVEGHKNNLFLKSQTKNIAGLVIYAIQNNIVNPEEVMLH